MSVRRKVWILVAVALVPSMALPLAADSTRKRGLQGCEDYREDPLCISVRAANREGTLHGGLGAGCPTNAAARPPIQEGTELSIVMTHGTVGDLAIKLGCMLKLEGGVAALPDVSDLTFANLRWNGLLGRQAAGPIPTREGRDVWMVLREDGRRLEVVGERDGNR